MIWAMGVRVGRAAIAATNVSACELATEARTMTPEDITEALRLHQLWLEGNPDGRQADLRKADLHGAELSGVDLYGADLRKADLRDAKMGGANLNDADLKWADLRGADIRGANLNDADLSDAKMGGADLNDVDLSDAKMGGADLSEAKMGDVNLIGADLRGAILPEGIPIIPDIHRAVYDAASAPGALDMGQWHCGTTHCRAGWVVTLAGEDGKRLEARLGTSAAAALIYYASDPTLEHVPDWGASNEEALFDMARLAGVTE
jgi:hypothetical protein